MKSGIFLVFLSLTMAGLFLACEKDDDPPDPSGSLPNVEFTYSPININNGMEIDDYEALTHIIVDFPVVFDELSSWEKIEINYGNGIIHKYEPYDPRQGLNPVIYYSPGTYQITARVYNSSGMKEMSKDIEILPMKTFKYQYLNGIWSIINEKVSPGAGLTIEKPRKKYHKMFEFGVWEPQYFNYSRRDMHWVEEEYGAFTIDGFNIHTIPENGNDYPPLTLTVDSFYRSGGEVHLAMHSTMQDDDIGEIRYDADLIYIDLSDPWYHFEQSLDDYKWSIIEEETNIYAYSDLTMKYNDLIETIPNETIPYNLLTVDLRDGPDNTQIIDNWDDGSYERIDNYNRYRIFYRLRIGKWDSINWFLHFLILNSSLLIQMFIL